MTTGVNFKMPEMRENKSSSCSSSTPTQPTASMDHSHRDHRRDYPNFNPTIASMSLLVPLSRLLLLLLRLLPRTKIKHVIAKKCLKTNKSPNHNHCHNHKACNLHPVTGLSTTPTTSINKSWPLLWSWLLQS